MFYFFQKGSDFLRCEINGDEESGYHITVTEPDGRERTEQFESGDLAHARWLEIQEEFKGEGWWGPHGRD